jgi:hypothetical protein
MIQAAVLAGFTLAVAALVATAAHQGEAAARQAARTYRQVVLAARPVGYWRLGERRGPTAFDASGHRRHGRYVGSPRLGLPGAITGDTDTSIGLDGPRARSYVEVPSNAAFSVPTSGAGLTVEVWLRTPARLDFPGEGDPRDGQAPYVYWLGKGEEGQREWALRFYSSRSRTRPNRISAYIFNPTAPRGRVNLGAGAYFQERLRPNEWIHVVATYDPPGGRDALVRIYHNGQPSAHNDSTGTLYRTYRIVPRAGRSPLRLGTRDQSSFLTGGLDEVAIYPRVLAAEEIARHYEVGRQR